jgi:hypothetical protein
MPDNHHRATVTVPLYTPAAYLALVQPLSDLAKVSRQASVQQPLPVANLCSHFLPVCVKLLPGISTNANLKVVFKHIVNQNKVVISTWLFPSTN